MSELLVWTGTHPNEKKALKTGDSLRDNSIPRVTTDIANPKALELGLRLVDINLMNAYPGDPSSQVYESRRAIEILKKCRNFECVIDLHSIEGHGETTAVIDRKQGVAPKVLNFLGALGVRNLVLSEEMGMHGHTANSFVLEAGPALEVDRLRAALSSLANGASSSRHREAADFAWFEFLDSLHEKHLHPHDLDRDQFNKLRPFTEFPELTVMMGRKAYLMSWSSEPNREGYWGELITPCSMPDTFQWVQ